MLPSHSPEGSKGEEMSSLYCTAQMKSGPDFHHTFLDNKGFNTGQHLSHLNRGVLLQQLSLI